MEKIILYYKFTPVADPDMTMRWQRELCIRLALTGRVIISGHGINGTLGGPIASVKMYIKEMNKTNEFAGIMYKWSDGGADDFPRLSVKVRQELVTLAPDEQFDVFDSGTPLSPEAWHRYLEEHPDAIVFDARNDYESAIGTFKNAIRPSIKTFKEIRTHVDSLPTDKPVLTYCTGDIRCEYLSAYMRHKGFENVYHLSGGIVKYGEQFGDSGFWEGKCYVFDKRMHLSFSDASKDIGNCTRCKAKTSNYANCSNVSCNRLVLLCPDCCSTDAACSTACSTVNI